MVNPLCLGSVLWLKPGEGIAASGIVPKDAEFFQDHFPGFPVLPGVLGLEILKQTAEWYIRQVGETEAKKFRLVKVSGVKFTQYLKPGDAWESHLEIVSTEDGQTTWKARLIHQGQPAVTARLVLEEIRAPRPTIGSVAN